MPTIEVSEETLKFLQEAQELLKTQDNRSTANVLFLMKYPEKVYADFGDNYHSEGEEWVDRDNSEDIGTNEDLFEYLLDNWVEVNKILEDKYIYDHTEPNTPPEEIDPEVSREELKEWFVETVEDSYDDCIGDILRNMYDSDDGDKTPDFSFLPVIERVSYRKVEMTCGSGLFSFFEKDVELHTKLNGHNFYKGQYSYGASIQRSPLMLQLREFLLKQDFKKI